MTPNWERDRQPVTITEFTEVTDQKTSFHSCASVTMSRNIQVITNQHFLFYFKKEIVSFSKKTKLDSLIKNNLKKT